MKAAVARLRGIARSAVSQRLLIELGLAFAEVGDISAGHLPWNEVVLDRTNRAWSDLLKLAKLLLGDHFQTTSSGRDAGFSILFEMNTLFEEYIGRLLQTTLQRNGTRVTLQRMAGHALIGADGKGRFATMPDIVVETADQDDWIIDTKWKRLKGNIDDPKYGIAQSDVYQMMAYSQVHHCRRLMLLYPHHDGIQREPGRIAEFFVAGTTDTKLIVGTVDLCHVNTVPAQLTRLLGLDTKQAPVQVAAIAV